MHRLLFSLVLLAACQPAFINGMPNENSPYFEVPVDSIFVSQQPLSVPPRTDRLYFQGGRLLAWYDVNQYSSYCVLRLNSKSESLRTIAPDRFTVRNVSTENLFQVAHAPAAQQVAMLGVVAAADIDSGDHDPYEVVAMVMTLGSARQPEVNRLACADWGFPQNSRYITVNKIRQALGSFFRLELASRTQ